MGEGTSQMEKRMLSLEEEEMKETLGSTPQRGGHWGGSVSSPGVLASSGGRCWEAEEKGLLVPQGQTSLI